MEKAKGSSMEGTPSLVVLITGVSQGIGRALALELVKSGHTIIGCSRNQNKLDSLRTQLSHHNHLLLKLDVTSDASVEDLVQAVLERNLVPDILVNNAGIINEKSKFWEISVDEFDSIIDTNVKGTANVLRRFIPLMIANEKRIIVNISSGWGRIGAPMVGMAIIALHPGIIHTDMLVTCYGELAANYPNPETWAVKASTMILNFTSADNGASLSVEE